MTQTHGDNGTNVTVIVGLVANPPVEHYTWTMNGRNLSQSTNVKVGPGELHFTPLLVESKGNYSVHDCNNISCHNFDFELDVYCKLWVWFMRGMARCGYRGCLGYEEREITVVRVLVAV